MTDSAVATEAARVASHHRCVFINSRLHGLTFAWKMNRREWLFNGGEPWLRLTPMRMGRLTHRLGLKDRRVRRLFFLLRRWHPKPEAFCRLMGVRPVAQVPPSEYPLIVCPECDGLHYPHPEDAAKPCPACEYVRNVDDGGEGPTLLERRERERDRVMRKRILKKDPSAFDDGELRPNWRLNKLRELQRDWDSAVNRILLGQTYRDVARDLDCSVGVLHKRVKNARTWENN